MDAVGKGMIEIEFFSLVVSTNQPHLKKYAQTSNWIIISPKIGMKIENIEENHHLVER